MTRPPRIDLTRRFHVACHELRLWWCTRLDHGWGTFYLPDGWRAPGEGITRFGWSSAC